MNEFSSKFDVEEKTIYFSKLTFYELSKQNISSEQLYLWLAPIDLIENYQLYLNQFDLSLSKEIFYNCTLPRFGPQCQYEFDYYYSSLSELIHQYYTSNEYNPNTLTCYKHLKCSRGPSSSCLDWSEICDGKIDCLDGGLDEEHCWKLEINECQDNEYRCSNGQCIPEIFHRDGKRMFDCIDGSDETFIYLNLFNSCNKNESLFGCEDIICKENPLTRSCVIKRKYLLMKSMFSMKDNSTSEECWFAIQCMFDRLYSEEPSYHELCVDNSSLKTFLDTCPEMLYIPNYPILFGDTYIAGKKSELKEMINSGDFNLYICYNHHSHYDVSLYIFSEILFNNRTCFKGDQFKFLFYEIGSAPITKYYKFIDHVYNRLKQYRLLFNYTSTICNRSNMYQCINSSKCIPVHRLFNEDVDCPYGDDQIMSIINNNPIIMEQLNKTHFYCQASKKYFSQNFINNGRCDCRDDRVSQCVDENVGREDSSNDIFFQTICDGFRELLPIIINNKNETDETECEEWECDNIYTHCDGVWNCLNGKDEIGCDYLSRSMCSLNEHLCVSLLTYRFSCLDISKVNDGHLDCVGGTDEPIKIINPSQYTSFLTYGYKFSCMNQTPSPGILRFMLCDGQNICNHGDDEKFCETDQTKFIHRGICLPGNIDLASNVEKFLCAFIDMKSKRSIIHFKLKDMIHSVSKMISPIEISPKEHKSGCHRGLSLRVNEINFVCLCPPSYYG
jgi:hypothetical protein